MTNSISRKNKSDGLGAFFLLTFGLMLATWGVLALSGLSVASTTNTDAPTSTLAMVLYLLGGFTPSIAGFIMAYRQNGREGLRDLGKRFIQFNLGLKWYLIIIAIPLVVQVGIGFVYWLQGGQFTPSELLSQPAALLATLIPVFLFGPLSEEFGWRGFAQDRVQARWGFLQGNVLLGLMWGFWHLPLFFVAGSGQQQAGNPLLVFPSYVVWVVSMTMLFAWVYNHTNRSIWGAMLFHFMNNFMAVLLLEVADMTPQFMYLTNSVVWFILVVVFLMWQRTSVSHRPKQHDEQPYTTPTMEKE